MKTIYTDSHILLVDEKHIVSEKDKSTDNFIYDEETNHMVKIIAASPKLGELPEFETLPPTEDDVEKLAEKQYPTLHNKEFKSDATANVLTKLCRSAYTAGHNQANQTFNELIKFVESIRDDWKNVSENYQIKAEKLLQSLTKLKEYEFIPEMEERFSVHGDKHDNSMKPDSIRQPKAINNKVQGTWQLKK